MGTYDTIKSGDRVAGFFISHPHCYTFYMKAHTREAVKKLTDIPNVGPRIAHDFSLLGISEPRELARRDAYTLYKELERVTGTRQDPCVLDTYIAVIDFMNGAPRRPWFYYTPLRKKKYGNGRAE